MKSILFVHTYLYKYIPTMLLHFSMKVSTNLCLHTYTYVYTNCNICTSRCILWVGGMWWLRWGWYVMWGYWTTYGLVLKVLDNAMQAYRWPQLSSDIKRVDSCQNSRQIWCTCHWRLGGEVIVNILWNRGRKGKRM